jgi:hypothetical protein
MRTTPLPKGLPVARNRSAFRILVSRTLALILLVGCGATHSEPRAQQSPAKEVTVAEIVPVSVRGGIACSIGGVLRPVSYRVTDIGKPGVRLRAPSDRKMLRRIRHYFNPPTLRFLYAESEFVGINAAYGPCYDAAPGYKVLNGYCNEVYQGSWFGTGAIPECWNPRRPWIPDDTGRGDARYWER